MDLPHHALHVCGTELLRWENYLMQLQALETDLLRQIGQLPPADASSHLNSIIPQRVGNSHPIPFQSEVSYDKSVVLKIPSGEKVNPHTLLALTLGEDGSVHLRLHNTAVTVTPPTAAGERLVLVQPAKNMDAGLQSSGTTQSSTTEVDAKKMDEVTFQAEMGKLKILEDKKKRGEIILTVLEENELKRLRILKKNRKKNSWWQRFRMGFILKIGLILVLLEVKLGWFLVYLVGVVLFLCGYLDFALEFAKNNGRAYPVLLQFRSLSY